MDREVWHFKVGGEGYVGIEMANPVGPRSMSQAPLPNDAALLTKPQPAIPVSQAWK